MDNNDKGSRGVRKERRGEVVGKSGDKTVVVRVERRHRHKMYGKTMKQTKRYHTHDEKNSAAVGDRVRIVECRPISCLKKWRLVEVLENRGAGS